MNDGIRINGVWVSPAAELRLTIQANDIQKPTTLQTSYSSAFTLPDTLTVRQVTQGAEATNSYSRVPYNLEPADLTQSGIVTFDGFVKFLDYKPDTGWSVNLVDKTRSIYSQLDRSLRTLDLSRWLFTWGTAAVIDAAENTTGYCFPLVDYGALENGGQAVDLLLPAVFGRTLLETMVDECGYTLDWPTGVYQDWLDALVVPVSSSRPKLDFDQKFVTDRQARVGLGIGVGLFTVSHSDDVNVPVPFVVVDEPTKGFTQGATGNYRSDLKSYVPDTRMRLAYEVVLRYRLQIISGAVRLTFQLLKNGVVVKQESYEESGPHNVFQLNYQQFKWTETIEVNQGDRISFNIIADQFTFLGKWELILDDEGSSVTFAPDLTVQVGDNYPLSANLPSMTCLDFLKSCALACCGTYMVNNAQKILRFVPLSPVIADRANAQDWSHLFDEDGVVSYTPRIEPYGQRSILAYKQSGEGTQGNGEILINGSALVEKVELFTLPFGPVPSSNKTVGQVNVLPQITLRTVDRATDGTTTITDTEPGNGPHWLLVHRSLTEKVKTIETINGKTVTTEVPLRVAWFDNRPTVLTTSSSPNINLSFNDPRPGEAGLINTFFTGLMYVLDRPRTLELMVRLTAPDLSGLRLDQLVYISSHSVGGLALPPTYYYIAQIADYQPDTPSRATLNAAS